MAHNKKTVDEEDALESALSPVVNRLIDKNFENSGDKIASQIAPLIGGAIREQIKSQKDDIVDALYPVMGSMISKFVTKSLEELLNKINEQIQNGLSVQTIKRKIKAKLKGVSETELLLQESSEANIKAVLLIHKESGVLLAKAQNEQENLNDADMLASMMTAIRSFVNDWVESDNTSSELGEIEYGGNKIIIEASGYSYLAVIVEGAAYTKTYTKIRNTLEKIVLEYGQEIKAFNANLESIPQEALEKELYQLIKHDDPTQQHKEQKRHPILLLLPLLFAIWMAYTLYQNYIDTTLTQKAQTLLQTTPTLTPFRIDVDVDKEIATIEGSVPFSYHKDLAQQLVEKIRDIKTIHNNIIVIPTLTDPMQVSANIAYLLAGANLDKDITLLYDFDYNTLTLKGKLKDIKTKERILEEIQKIKGIQNIKDEIGIVHPNINLHIYFDTASSKLNQETQRELTKTVDILKQYDINNTLQLKAYSDMIGDLTVNRRLAQERIQAIENFLTQEGGLTNKIESQIFDRAPLGIDPTKEPKKARRITLTLKKSETK